MGQHLKTTLVKYVQTSVSTVRDSRGSSDKGFILSVNLHVISTGNQ